MSTSAAPRWRSSPPFYQHLGFELVALADGKSEICLPFQDYLGNSRGEVHGGAIATLADGAMSQAIRSNLEPGVAVATISMTLSYLAPAVGRLTCRGAVVRGGRSIVFAEAEVIDERGTVACRASGSFRVLPRKDDVRRESAE